MKLSNVGFAELKKEVHSLVEYVRLVNLMIVREGLNHKLESYVESFNPDLKKFLPTVP